MALISGGSKMLGRREMAALVAEFLGAGALTLLVLTVQRSTIGVPFFVAAAAGLTLALMVFAVGSNLSGYFNPAITLALWTVRKLPSLTAVLNIAVQLLGAWGAYYLYTYLVNNPLQPIGGHFTGRVLVAEAVGTGVLGLGIAAAIYQGLSRAVTASFAGVALMLGTVAASSAAIGLLNPATALGVRAWVWGTYVLGPVLGAIIGVNLYSLLFAESERVSVRVASSAPAAAASAKRPARKSSAKKKTSRAKK